MKRFLVLLIIFCLFALPCHAGVTGSVSLANSRLSLVNGTAFVDFSAAGTLTPYINYRLTLTDSAGKKASGYVHHNASDDPFVQMTYAASGSSGIAVPCHVAVTGSVSLANSRLSLVNGTAFVDFSAAGTLTPYLNGKLTLTDSAGKKAIGYIKAAGTGEVLSDDLVNDPGFADENQWTAEGNWSVAGGVATSSNGGTGTSKGLINKGTNLVPSALYKTVIQVVSRTAGAAQIRYPAIGSQRSLVNTYTEYLCNTDTSTTRKVVALSYADAFAGTIDNLSVKQVLTPSSTGVTIVSTRGGTTYDWESIESGFNYNDEAGYTYTIVPRFVGGGLGMGIIYGF